MNFTSTACSSVTGLRFEAAAETYYGKPLSELNLAQHAMLAGVPKAPSRNNPLSNPEKGKVRRDWILGRMANLGMIDERERLIAQNTPVTAAFYGQVVEVDADYVAEMVRQEMVERFGNGAYNDGYVVYTTVEADLQQAAHDALLEGLRTYDWRHGWRGPERRLAPREDETPEQTRARWEQALRDMPTIAKLPPAIVTSVSEMASPRSVKRANRFSYLGKAISVVFAAIDPLTKRQHPSANQMNYWHRVT